MDGLDLRVIRTKAAIREAFYELVLETNPDKITVKELSQRAQINRKTFYLHYESIEALFDEVLLGVMDIFFHHHEQTPEEPKDIAGHAKRFFMFLAEQDIVIERLICSKTSYDFGGKLYLMQMERYKSLGADPFEWLEVKEDLVLHFIRSTALQFYRRWVRMGKTIDVSEAADLLAELTCNGVGGLMR